MTRETNLEKKLMRTTKTLGGVCIKLYALWYIGIPDRLLLLPGGRAIFVELKAKYKKPSVPQLGWHRKLRKLGFQVEVPRGPDDLNGLITTLKGNPDAL